MYLYLVPICFQLSLPETESRLFILQGNHNACDPESKCKMPGYRCSKVQLTSPLARIAQHKFILSSKVYQLAEDYYLVTLNVTTLYFLILVFIGQSDA